MDSIPKTPTINIVQEKVIKSLLKTNYELLTIAYSSIFTASKDAKQWLFSELEGGLCLVIDYIQKSARFMMFDLQTFEILFECELYKDFNKYYIKANEVFHYFEVNGGFIGFKFNERNLSDRFFTEVKILDKNKINKILIFQKSSFDLKKSAKILDLLEKKLSEEYLFKYAEIKEKVIEFNVPLVEKHLKMLKYDSERKQFEKIGSNDELEDIVGKVLSLKSSVYENVNNIEHYSKEVCKSVLNSKKCFARVNSTKIKPEELKRMQDEKIKEEKKEKEMREAYQKKMIEEKKKEEERLKAEEIKRLENKKKEDERKKIEDKKNEDDLKKKAKEIGSNKGSKVPAVPNLPIPKVPSVPKVPLPPPKVPTLTKEQMNTLNTQNQKPTKEVQKVEEKKITPNLVSNDKLEDIKNNNNEEVKTSEEIKIQPTPKKLDLFAELKMKMAARENKNNPQLNNQTQNSEKDKVLTQVTGIFNVVILN